MEGFEQYHKPKKKRNKISTFSVPFVNVSIKNNLSISTEAKTKPSKEQIINQAIKFHLQGNITEAVQYYKYFISEGFTDPRVFSNYGVILNDLGNLEEAEISQRKAIELEPEYADAYSNLGNTLRNSGKLEEAELSVRKAIELQPNFANAYHNLGNILSDLGKFKEAELSQRKAIEINPNLADAHLNLGGILIELNQLKEAQISTLKAISSDPNLADAHNNLGTILNGLGKSKEAESSIRKAIEIKPDYADAYYNLGNTLLEVDKLEEAKLAYEKSISLDPKSIDKIASILHLLSRLALWDEVDNYSTNINDIGIDGKAINPLALMYLEDNPENHLKRAINFSKQNISQEINNLSVTKKSKINIGYFSSDFRNHPITHLITRILELHDGSKFNIYAYSINNNNDIYTQRIKDAVFCFREVSHLSDIEIVKLARNDQIDIAIDLNGFTKFNRISIFNYRVAPVQINYLGYTGSLGSNSFDYIIADKVLIPEENKKFYTEKVLYLPNSCFPHDNKRYISNNKFSREELGLPLDGFVFTCFNSIQKITRKEFNIWIKLLQKVEKSVLWLVKPHNAAIKNLYSELNNNGLAQERLVFADQMKLDDHLSRHCCADLFLDTFNYNAGTTADFALSSGLPLITLLGKSYSSRIAASILSACNLNELVTHSYAEYENLAYELATNKEKLRKISEKLKNKKYMTYFDSSKFTNNLENTYTNISIC